MEQWKSAPGYEGIYSVSSEGRVRRDKPGPGATAGKILKGSANPNTGHWSVSLWKDRKPTPTYVHRLVCEAFHGPAPEGKPLALHWDDNPGNNRAENLRWGNKKENADDALRTGRKPLRESCKRGHPRTIPNTRRANESWRCRACSIEHKNSRKESRPFDNDKANQNLERIELGEL